MKTLDTLAFLMPKTVAAQSATVFSINKVICCKNVSAIWRRFTGIMCRAQWLEVRGLIACCVIQEMQILDRSNVNIT